MNILFLARASLFAQPGGDTQQIVQSADALRELGLEVTIRLHGEPLDLDAYDLLHFFNAGRPADCLALLPTLKIPFVVSSIWVDYSEWDQRQNNVRGTLARFAGKFGFEYLKSIGRGLSETDKFPGFRYLLLGQKAAMAKLLQRADAIIASSASERNRLDDSFNVGPKTSVIALGINPAFYEDAESGEEADERSGVVCVGRIEGLKNQLNLIRAAKDAHWNLQIIGKPALNQPHYFAQCQAEAGKNVEFVGWLSTEHLALAYKKAKVLVLPSYFETFGLVALEAMANGCNIVLSNRPDMNSIFADRAIFCNPGDPADIKTKINEALALPPMVFSTDDWSRYSWQTHAAQLHAIYTRLLP